MFVVLCPSLSPLSKCLYEDPLKRSEFFVALRNLLYMSCAVINTTRGALLILFPVPTIFRALLLRFQEKKSENERTNKGHSQGDNDWLSCAEDDAHDKVWNQRWTNEKSIEELEDKIRDERSDGEVEDDLFRKSSSELDAQDSRELGKLVKIETS